MSAQPRNRFGPLRALLIGTATFACAPDEPPPPVAQATTEQPAPSPAGPDIVLARLTGTGTALHLVDPENITARPGYDNQPSFTPDGNALLYTEGNSEGRMDIIRYELATGQRSPLHPTPDQSEYSATVTPSGSGVSVVRVEPDSAQRLWRLLEDDEEVILPDLAPVGYQAWVDEQHVALFVLGDPVTLVLADPTTGATEVVAERIGRSLQRIPGRRAVSYSVVPDSVAWLRVLDVDTGRSADLVPALEGSEDHAWTPDGVILMGRGSLLFARDPSTAEDWTQVADLSGFGSHITRIAVHPNGGQIAVVLDP